MPPGEQAVAEQSHLLAAGPGKPGRTAGYRERPRHTAVQSRQTEIGDGTGEDKSRRTVVAFDGVETTEEVSRQIPVERDRNLESRTSGLDDEQRREPHQAAQGSVAHCTSDVAGQSHSRMVT